MATVNLTVTGDGFVLILPELTPRHCTDFNDSPLVRLGRSTFGDEGFSGLNLYQEISEGLHAISERHYYFFACGRNKEVNLCACSAKARGSRLHTGEIAL